MRLSEINPEEVVIEDEVAAPAPKLSEIDPAEIQPDDDPGFGKTADGSMRNPLDVDWIGAIKNEFTKPLDPSAKAALGNPAVMQLAGQAGASAIGAGLSKVTPVFKAISERFATSPLPSKISEATNVVGKGKTIAEKFVGSIGESLPGGAKKAMDVFSGVAGRKAAYSNPVTGVPQLISDSARAVSGAQKGVAWILDNAPDKLGKFAGILQKAKAAGPSAFATANFLLQSKNPEYQEILKKANNQ